eukprot:gene2352-2820_t
MSNNSSKCTRNSSFSDYSFGVEIGSGGTSKVVICFNRKTKKKYACKISKLSSSRIEYKLIKKEITLLSNLNSPFIVKYIDCFIEKEQIFLILELIEGGMLFDYYFVSAPNFFSEELVKFYTAQLLISIEYIHKRNIIHRDIKLENIMIEDKTGRLKLIDFGHAIQKRNAKSFCGTIAYMAPEIFLGREYTKAVDFYSFGIIIFELLFGYLPYDSDDQRKNIRNILVLKLEFPKNKTISDAAKNLISGLLERDKLKNIHFLHQ